MMRASYRSYCLRRISGPVCLARLPDFGGASLALIASRAAPVAEESLSWGHPACSLRCPQTILTPSLTCSYVLQKSKRNRDGLVILRYLTLYYAEAVERLRVNSSEALAYYRAEVCEM